MCGDEGVWKREFAGNEHDVLNGRNDPVLVSGGDRGGQMPERPPDSLTDMAHSPTRWVRCARVPLENYRPQNLNTDQVEI